RSHPRDNQLLNTAVLQDCVEVGSKKSALARLVDHRFPRQRVKLRDDVVSGFTSDQDTTHRPLVPDRRCAAATDFFCRRQICQIRSMPLSCVYDLQTSGSPSGKQFSIRIYRAAQSRDIVSKHLAKSARLKKVPLHVDDEERTARGLEFEFVRFGVNAEGSAHLHG